MGKKLYEIIIFNLVYVILTKADVKAKNPSFVIISSYLLVFESRILLPDFFGFDRLCDNAFISHHKVVHGVLHTYLNIYLKYHDHFLEHNTCKTYLPIFFPQKSFGKIDGPFICIMVLLQKAQFFVVENVKQWDFFQFCRSKMCQVIMTQIKVL